jgi:hypothetical protein
VLPLKKVFLSKSLAFRVFSSESCLTRRLLIESLGNPSYGSGMLIGLQFSGPKQYFAALFLNNRSLKTREFAASFSSMKLQ